LEEHVFDREEQRRATRSRALDRVGSGHGCDRASRQTAKVIIERQLAEKPQKSSRLGVALERLRASREIAGGLGVERRREAPASIDIEESTLERSRNLESTRINGLATPSDVASFDALQGEGPSHRH